MIIWGRKTVRTPLGYAADYCPICGGAQAFAIQRLGSAGHLYFITVGEGALLGYSRTCTACSIELDADPDHYASLVRAPLGLQALRQATHPQLDARYQAQLALDAQLRANPLALPAQDRLTLITRPFLLLAPRVSTRFATTSIDWGGRFMQHEILPLLARALQRLRPSAAELDLALQTLRQRRELIGQKVQRAALLAAIAAPPAERQAAHPTAGGAPVFAPPPHSAVHQRRAGGLLRVLGWLLGAAAVIGGLASLAGPPSGNSPAVRAAVWLGMATMASLLVITGRGVTQGRPWARKAGIAWALILSAGFPVGTVPGLYLLWCLALRWPTPSAAALPASSHSASAP